MFLERYEPSLAPNLAEWLALDETTRIDLVREFHIKAGEENPKGSEKIHAAIHVVVENQLAMGVKPVPETMAKLMRQGLGRHEAIHAIGAVLSGDIYDLLHGSRESWNPLRYRKRLEKLTAKRWRKGKW